MPSYYMTRVSALSPLFHLRVDNRDADHFPRSGCGFIRQSQIRQDSDYLWLSMNFEGT